MPVSMTMLAITIQLIESGRILGLSFYMGF
jgi:hypothetical protein